MSWIPNAICVLRLALIGPVILALLSERYVLALILIALAGFSDLLDGFIARFFDWRTTLGSLLDPLADKLLVVSVFVTLTWLGLVPLGLTIIVVLRDVVIVAGAVTYRFVIAPVRGEPAVISKLNTACQVSFVMLTLIAETFQWPVRTVLIGLGAAVVFTSVTSGLSYVVEWSKRAWRSAHEEHKAGV